MQQSPPQPPPPMGPPMGPPPPGMPPPMGPYPPGMPPPMMPPPMMAPGFVPVLLEDPIMTRCPQCGANIVTATEYESGCFTFTSAALLIFLGCFLGCCIIPFCMNWSKDVLHYCPNCGAFLGRWNRAS